MRVRMNGSTRTGVPSHWPAQILTPYVIGVAYKGGRFERDAGTSERMTEDLGRRKQDAARDFGGLDRNKFRTT